MRVNVDSKALRDPRFARLGKALAITRQEALGVCLEVWMYSFEQRSEFMTAGDIDEVVGRSGFGAAMHAADLAELVGERLRLRGVRARIGYLVRQRQSARAGGKASAAKRIANKAARLEANASRVGKQPLKRLHTDLDLDQDQVLDPDQDQAPDQPLVLTPPAASSVSDEGTGTKTAIASFCDRYRQKYGKTYTVSGRDAGQMKRLVAKHAVGEVNRRIAVLFDNPPWKLSQNAPDIGTLDTNWNTLVGAALHAVPSKNGQGRAEPASADQHAADAARGASPWR